jgi:hypothetical protein
MEEAVILSRPLVNLVVGSIPFWQKYLAIGKKLFANSENLTPQPPSLLGKGEPGSPSPRRAIPYTHLS